MNDWLDPLRRVLDRSLEPVTFLFRDNNVGREDESLYEMLDVFAAHEIPIDLGVITDLVSESLARNLQARLVASNARLALHEHKITGRSFPTREASTALNVISSDVTELMINGVDRGTLARI